MRRFALLVALSVLLPICASAEQVWEVLGPGGLDTATFAIDPSNSDILYAAGAFSLAVLFKSVDGGQTWASADNGLEDVIDSLSSDPGVLHILAIDPADPRTIYAGTRIGVAKSTDAASTWTVVSPPSIPVLSLAIDRTNHNVIYAGGPSGVLLKTVDGGVSWTAGVIAAIDEVISTLAIDPTNANVLYASTSAPTHGNVLKSTDGGLNWRGGLGLPALVGIARLAISPGTPNVLYAGTGNPAGNPGFGLYKTIDGGMTWSEANGHGNMGLIRGGGVYADVFGVAVDPSHPNTVYVSGPGVLESLDAGATWTGIDDGLGSTDTEDLQVVAKPTERVLYVASRGNGILRLSCGSTSCACATGHCPCTTARCILEAAVMSADCAQSVIPTRVTAKFTRAELLIDKAATTSGKKASKLLRKAKRALKRAGAEAAREAKGAGFNFAGCATALERAANSVRSTLGS